MPVSGQELATLDFANLIGGPLNAVVTAQAKSAITTVSFIKEVAFDENKKIINVDFTYDRTNNDGKDQRFTLTVPFLTMLPVPYITVSDATVDFNAKITSVTESSVQSSFSADVAATTNARFWFVSASVTAKTAYQSASSSTDRQERTFDMHVHVEAQNHDMPAGTERLLTILENCITEAPGSLLASFTLGAKSTGNRMMMAVTSNNFDVLTGKKFKATDTTNAATEFTITAVDANAKTITLDKEINDSAVGQTFKVEVS